METELKDRISSVRKAAGLTQEQLGELLGVTRQAVSKWESGQTVPDAVTIARLCQALRVSADYVLLGREPEAGGAPPAYTPPETCPCCGRSVSGSFCPVCGYPLPTTPPRGGTYAIVTTNPNWSSRDQSADLVKYCGFTEEDAQSLLARYSAYGSRVLLRRGLDDQAARWIAAHLDRDFFSPRIVEDLGEEDALLLDKPPAMELPEAPKNSSIGFLGVVGAVIVALLILSFF